MMIKFVKKYSTIVKYLFSSGTSFVLDLLLFSIFNFFLKNILGDYSIFASTVLARVLSSFYNYLMNRNAVFKSGEKTMDMNTFVKYYILVIVQMMVSSILVFVGYRTFQVAETLVKIPVDVFLFIVNYIIQKRYIFNK